jgi:hypothetical protein
MRRRRTSFDDFVLQSAPTKQILLTSSISTDEEKNEWMNE